MLESPGKGFPKHTYIIYNYPCMNKKRIEHYCLDLNGYWQIVSNLKKVINHFLTLFTFGKTKFLAQGLELSKIFSK